MGRWDNRKAREIDSMGNLNKKILLFATGFLAGMGLMIFFG